MCDISIRDARLEDVPAINALFNSTVLEGVLDWDKPQPLKFHQEWFEKMQDYPLLVAVNIENTAVAYGGLEPQCTAEGSSCQCNTNLHVFVDLQYRRQCIATDIWRALCDHQLTSDRSVFLVICTLLSNNDTGISFAKSLDFNYQGKLDKMAVKDVQFVDQLTFTSYIGTSPPMQGVGFPDEERFSLSPSPEAVEIHLDSPKFVIREATLEDLPFLISFYNQVILSSTALEYSVPKTMDERREWLQRLLDERYPCLIAEEDGTSLGYISLTPWNESPDQSYTYSAYISAYVRKDLKRKRVGEALYCALLEHRYLQEDRIFTVIADITSVNGPALAGSLKAGLRQAFTIPREMVKFGEAYSGIRVRREFCLEPDLRQLALERSSSTQGSS